MDKQTQQLLEIIAEQAALLDTIFGSQKKIREAVNAKNWERFECALSEYDRLSGQFTAKETERARFCASLSRRGIGGAGSGETNDMFAVLDCIPSQYRENVRAAFALVRRKLAVSRIENAALNEYLKITQNFLQGVFTTLTETRSNKVYSRTGGIVRAQPERLVLDRLL
ncbi:MAG: hypothetical protein LBS97_05050 [Treponema sp.]|nr:hypothetical protein [Treponema sp.]